MLSKNEIKDIQSLDQKKFRDEVRLFVAEGPKIVTELLELVPKKMQKIYALPKWIDAHENLLADNVVAVTESELQRISHLQTPNEVLAVVEQFMQQEPSIKDSFCLYLDTLQDPGNVGTIIRLADWFGVPYIVCSAGCADIYNPKVVQSSMASIARVGVYYDMANDWLQKQEAPVFAATLHGKPIHNISKTTNGVLVIGNESKGIRKEYIELAKQQITIPKKGAAESLNAAVATGIILSHLLS